MDQRNTLAIIALIPLYGFGIGLHLDLIDTGEMFHIENLVKNVDLEPQSNSLMSTAFMSGEGDGTIAHASIALVLDKVLVDPSEEKEKDEYFDNRIKECIFHSEDDIDHRVCLACKILDEEIEPCEDMWMDFLDFEDGVFEDEINAANLGFTVKGVANGGMPDGLYVWNPDLNHPSVDDIIDAPFPNPPGTDTEDDDIENTFSAAAGGECDDCDGSDFHILVFADDDGNLNANPPNSTPDGLPEPMDDSERGGTVTMTLDTPKRWVSFDIADIENDEQAVAKAYSNTLPNGDCDPLSIIKVVPIPLTLNAQVQTVFVGAQNVSCLTVSWDDSGGLTNFDFKCIKTFDHEDVIAVGVLDLEEGYIGSTKISIPFEEAADVFESMSVVVDLVNPVIDFEVLDHGADHNDIAAYLLANFDITLEVEGLNGIDEATIYDSEEQGGADDDLDQPLFPEPDPIGKLLIMKEDAGNQPNDSAAGGTIRYTTEEAMTWFSMDMVDHEPSVNDISEVRFYEESDCSDTFEVVDIPVTENGNCSNDCHWATVDFGAAGEDVKCVEIVYEDSGGFANFHKACPSPSEWMSKNGNGFEGCTPGKWKQSHHFGLWVGHSPGDSVVSVFSAATVDNTLLEALNFGGGSGLEGKEQNLLRAAVAAVLNAENSNINYPRSVTDIKNDVNNAISSGVESTMENLQLQLDDDNNLGCFLD